MTSSTMSRLLAIVALVVAMGLAGCSAPASQPAAPAEPGANTAAPDAGGQDASGGDEAAFVKTKCTMCHTYERVESATYDEAGWTDVVGRMQQKGLVVTDEEKARIIAFLAAQ